MNYSIRIAREVFAAAKLDLGRPHLFAYERVGFLWGRVGSIGTHGTVVLINDFTTVPDNHYVNDDTVGARIDATAIRTALQRALDSGEACFHFHAHSNRGRPRLSETDVVELNHLMPSFASAVPTAVHGAVVASMDAASAWVWPRHANRVEALRISVVGFPTDVWGAE